MVKEMWKRMKHCSWFPIVTAEHVTLVCSVCSDMFASYVIYESQARCWELWELQRLGIQQHVLGSPDCAGVAVIHAGSSVVGPRGTCTFTRMTPLGDHLSVSLNALYPSTPLHTGSDTDGKKRRICSMVSALEEHHCGQSSRPGVHPPLALGSGSTGQLSLRRIYNSTDPSII